MLSESTVTAWEIKNVRGQRVVSMGLALGFDQSVRVNLNPDTIPDICMRLLIAYDDFKREMEDADG